LALHFDLLPDDLRAPAAQALVRDIRKRKDHLSTGFVGTPYLCHVLTRAGHADVAYDLLYQKTWPSWLYSVTQGGTTIWERWDGWTHDKGFQDVGMNSFNHYAYGAIGSWLYQCVAGIELDPDRPGYEHIVLRPTPGGELKHASAVLDSIRGRIRSAWKIQKDRFTWEVEIPPNTRATAHVPSKDGKALENGKPASQAPGVKSAHQEKNGVVLELGSGVYSFSSRR
jgi:alpha-L-rhamnosidase